MQHKFGLFASDVITIERAITFERTEFPKRLMLAYRYIYVSFASHSNGEFSMRRIRSNGSAGRSRLKCGILCAFVCVCETFEKLN